MPMHEVDRDKLKLWRIICVNKLTVKVHKRCRHLTKTGNEVKDKWQGNFYPNTIRDCHSHLMNSALSLQNICYHSYTVVICIITTTTTTTTTTTSTTIRRCPSYKLRRRVDGWMTEPSASVIGLYFMYRLILTSQRTVISVVTVVVT